MRQARTADALAAKIRALLAGQGPDVQGAAIADLTAIWLAGHIVSGNVAATAGLRAEMFKMHEDLIWTLVAHYDERRHKDG